MRHLLSLIFRAISYVDENIHLTDGDDEYMIQLGESDQELDELMKGVEERNR